MCANIEKISREFVNLNLKYFFAHFCRSVWMTPDLLPFYAGTYFPPESSYGRSGFKAILLTISEHVMYIFCENYVNGLGSNFIFQTAYSGKKTERSVLSLVLGFLECSRRLPSYQLAKHSQSMQHPNAGVN